MFLTRPVLIHYKQLLLNKYLTELNTIFFLYTVLITNAMTLKFIFVIWSALFAHYPEHFHFKFTVYAPTPDPPKIFVFLVFFLTIHTNTTVFSQTSRKIIIHLNRFTSYSHK